MRSRKRIAAVAGMLAVLTAVGMLALNPFAKADPPGLHLDANSSRRVEPRLEHPDHPEWFVEAAVATDVGITDANDRADFVSPVGRVTRKNGVLRAQLDLLRVGIGAQVVNDYFPSKSSFARDNTPDGNTTTTACTGTPSGAHDGRYPLPYPVNGNLLDERPPRDGDCDTVSDLLINRLNSDDDYAGNVVEVRGFGDWQPYPAAGCYSVASKVFVAVRWVNGDYSLFSLRSGTVTANQLDPSCP